MRRPRREAPRPLPWGPLRPRHTASPAPTASQFLIAAVHDAHAEGVFKAEDVADLERRFKSHAVRRGGSSPSSPASYHLTKKGFAKVCEELGIRDIGIIGALFRKWDADGSGSIEFGEFLHIISFSLSGSATEKLEQAFALMDSNGDGFVTARELSSFFRTVYRAIGKPKTPSQVQSLVRATFAKLDKDYSLAIDRDEFLAAAGSIHLSTGDTLATLMERLLERFRETPSKDTASRLEAVRSARTAP